MAARGGRPETRPGDLIAVQYQRPKRYQPGSQFKIRTTRISKFKDYGELQSYLLEKCGGGYRTFPGGADYPVITYAKYNEDTIVRELRTEAWEEFAATVYHIFIERMVDEGRPQTRHGDLIAIQYRRPKPYQRGSVFKIRTTRISKFNNYVQLQSYLFEKCGGGRRIYPGGEDYPVITYNKYNEDAIERELGSEAWEDFAPTVYHILIKRVEA